MSPVSKQRTELGLQLSGKALVQLAWGAGVKISANKKQNCPLNLIQLLDPALITYTTFNNHNPITFKTEPHWGQQSHTTVKSQNKPVHQKQLHTKLRLPSLALHNLTTHLYMACHTQTINSVNSTEKVPLHLFFLCPVPYLLHYPQFSLVNTRNTNTRSP